MWVNIPLNLNMLLCNIDWKPLWSSQWHQQSSLSFWLRSPDHVFGLGAWMVPPRERERRVKCEVRGWVKCEVWVLKSASQRSKAAVAWDRAWQVRKEAAQQLVENAFPIESQAQHWFTAGIGLWRLWRDAPTWLDAKKFQWNHKGCCHCKALLEGFVKKETEETKETKETIAKTKSSSVLLLHPNQHFRSNSASPCVLFTAPRRRWIIAVILSSFLSLLSLLSCIPLDTLAALGMFRVWFARLTTPSQIGWPVFEGWCAGQDAGHFDWADLKSLQQHAVNFTWLPQRVDRPENSCCRKVWYAEGSQLVGHLVGAGLLI